MEPGWRVNFFHTNQFSAEVFSPNNIGTCCSIPPTSEFFFDEGPVFDQSWYKIQFQPVTFSMISTAPDCNVKTTNTRLMKKKKDTTSTKPRKVLTAKQLHHKNNFSNHSTQPAFRSSTAKTQHIFRERKRRQEMIESFQWLRSMLPALRSDKVPKVEVLKAAIVEIKRLHLEERSLLKEKSFLLESSSKLWNELYFWYHDTRICL